MSARQPAMAQAIRRREYERVALYLALAALERARTSPPGTVDDVLALLDELTDLTGPNATWSSGDDARHD